MIDIDLLPSEDLRILARQINLLLTHHLEEWLPPKEAKKLLAIKSNTKLLQLRDTGQIVFSQYGRTIQYSRKSINEFIDRHAVRF